MTLSETLSFVVTTLQRSKLCTRTHVVSTASFSASQFTLKVRAHLVDESVLQVRLYANEDHLDYAYQLFHNDKPIIRWDNKEHFPSIATHPHHFHNDLGAVTESPLTGLLINDLPLVLSQLDINYLL
jgi:hypothetical protein